MPEHKQAAGPRPAGEPRRAAFDSDVRLRRVRDRLEQDLSTPLTTAAAAAVAELNANYFSTYFRQRVGVRFTEWARLRRIEQAKRILSRNSLPIREVARAVGYARLRTFERAFKLVEATTPSAFRARVRAARRVREMGPSVERISAEP